MELDQLLTLASVVAGKVVPIAGAIALIYLAVFFKHLIVMIKNANDAVIELKKTLVTANKELETLEKPLQTICELSDTVDSVHEASKHAVRSTMVTIIDNFSSIKDMILNMLSKDEKGDPVVEQTQTTEGDSEEQE